MKRSGSRNELTPELTPAPRLTARLEWAPNAAKRRPGPRVEAVRPDADATREVVADKGCHSNQVLVDLEAIGVRSYISEPDRGRRKWDEHPEARGRVYRNRRRIRVA